MSDDKHNIQALARALGEACAQSGQCLHCIASALTRVLADVIEQTDDPGYLAATISEAIWNPYDSDDDGPDIDFDPRTQN